jgi:hypothetical protein
VRLDLVGIRCGSVCQLRLHAFFPIAGGGNRLLDRVAAERSRNSWFDSTSIEVVTPSSICSSAAVSSCCRRDLV